MTELYQFAFSHFCEKARWALDYKGISYRPLNLVPGLHMKLVRKIAPKTCLPVLVDGQTVIQDSAAIITYLDKIHPASALTPANEQEASEALEWERFFDEQIGMPLRQWFYYYTLPERELALKFLLQGAPWYGRPVFRLMFPKVRDAMTRYMNIKEETAKQSEACLLATFEKLDSLLLERRFIVGDRFSRADLTACALLSPFCLPGDTEASEKFPDAVRAFRDRHKDRRFYRWVLDTYCSHRRSTRC